MFIPRGSTPTSWMNRIWHILDQSDFSQGTWAWDRRTLPSWLVAQKFWVHDMLRPSEESHARAMDTVMVHFVCQLDWATGYPDIQSNTTLGVSVGVFLMRWTFELEDSLIRVPSPKWMGLKAWTEQNGGPPPTSKGELFLPDCFEVGRQSFLAFRI